MFLVIKVLLFAVLALAVSAVVGICFGRMCRSVLDVDDDYQPEHYHKGIPKARRRLAAERRTQRPDEDAGVQKP